MRSCQSVHTGRYLKYVVLISLIAGATYCRGLMNSFVAEDFTMMSLSTLPFSALWELMTSATRIRPLPVCINWVLYQGFGMNPLGYYLFVLVLHVVASVLVFFVGKSLSGDERVGLTSALLFVVYPRHHQPVLWLSADQFVLVGIFALISILCFRAYLRTGQFRYQLGTLICVCMALLANELGATLFPLLFLAEFILGGSEQKRWQSLFAVKTYCKYIPYLVLLILYIGVTFGGGRLFKLSMTAAEQQAASEGWQYDTYHLVGLGPKGAKDLAAYLTYLVYPQIPLRALDINLTTATVAAVTAFCLLALFIKGSPPVQFSVLWIFLTLAPFVLFVPFGNADRYFYVPAIGLAILAGILGCWGYDKLKARSAVWARMVAVLLMGLYLISSVMLMQQRIGEWHRAGEIAADVVEQAKRLYPNVPPESTMLFVALPDQYKQAYVFLGGGIGGAVYLAYGMQPSAPRAYRTRDPAVSSFLKEAEPVDDPLPGLYVFLYEDGILYDKSNVVSSLEPLRKGTWDR